MAFFDVNSLFGPPKPVAVIDAPTPGSSMDWLGKPVAQAAPVKVDLPEIIFSKFKGPIEDEWDRVLAIPRVEECDPATVDWLHRTRKYELRPIQAQTLAAIAKYHGLFGDITVGAGKTLIAWLSGVVMRSKKYVIMMPATNVEPFKGEIDRFRHHFVEPDVDPQIISYNLLSSAKSSDILDRLKPDLIVADEAHTLMNDSARTKRLNRYFETNPECRLVVMSGTFIDKKPSKLAKLVKYTLRDRAFMPTHGKALDVWAECVDLDGKPSEPDWHFFNKLAKAEGIEIGDYYGEERASKARKVVYSRMSTTPGVVSATKASLDTPIVCRKIMSTDNKGKIDVPDEIHMALRKIQTDEETPDGEDIILDDAQRARLSKNVSLGFFYRWAWEEVGGKDEEWLLRRRAWHRALRHELEDRAAVGYDSPLLVTNKISHDFLMDRSIADESLLHMYYRDWREVKDREVPPTVPVWISSYVFDWLKEYLATCPPTLIWYSSKACEQALAALGLPVYGQGSNVPTDGKTCAVSVAVHGTGKNLQPWHHNLIIEPMTSAKAWEQLMGRTHRPGQMADCVYFDILCHTSVLKDALDKAMEGAVFVKELNGADQRLLLAKWENA